jgi:hypothetical protein
MKIFFASSLFLLLCGALNTQAQSTITAKTALQLETTKASIKISPNTDFTAITAFIKVPKPKNYKIVISDLSGAIRQKSTFFISKDGNAFPIDITYYTDGTYFISVNDGNKIIASEKFIKF